MTPNQEQYPKKTPSHVLESTGHARTSNCGKITQSKIVHFRCTSEPKLSRDLRALKARAEKFWRFWHRNTWKTPTCVFPKWSRNHKTGTNLTTENHQLEDGHFWHAVNGSCSPRAPTPQAEELEIFTFYHLKITFKSAPSITCSRKHKARTNAKPRQSHQLEICSFSAPPEPKASRGLRSLKARAEKFGDFDIWISGKYPQMTLQHDLERIIQARKPNHGNIIDWELLIFLWRAPQSKRSCGLRSPKAWAEKLRDFDIFTSENTV